MVRFGDATKVTTADKTFDWLKEKQLYIDDKSNLVIGEKHSILVTYLLRIKKT